MYAYSFNNITIFMCSVLGILMLQMYLSSKQSRWPGLIIPIMCFMVTLSFAVYANAAYADAIEPIGLVISNIPTAILLLIYSGKRKKI